MEYVTRTGVKLTVIQGFKGIEQPKADRLEQVRDRCQSLHFTLESMRNALADALTLKQLSKFQATHSKPDSVRIASLPKRYREAYIEQERVRLELVALQAEFRSIRDAINTESEAI
jgi:hypothetical protein